MEYKGKLYGKIGKSYIPLLSTTDDVDAMEANIKQLKLKLSIAEKALNGILNWQEDVDGDWDYPETIASNALEKLSKIDGF